MDEKQKPLYELYTELPESGYQVAETYEEFEKAFTTDPDAENNRHALFEELKEQGLGPEDYETFYSTLFQPKDANTSVAIDPNAPKPSTQPQTKQTDQKSNGTATNVVPGTGPATETTDKVAAAKGANNSLLGGSQSITSVLDNMANDAKQAVTTPTDPQLTQSAQSASMQHGQTPTVVSQQEMARGYNVWKTKINNAFDTYAQGKIDDKQFKSTIESVAKDIESRTDNNEERNEFNTFIKDLQKRAQNTKSTKSVQVKAGYEAFPDNSDSVVWDFKLSRKQLPHQQDYVRTLRNMVTGGQSFNVMYNVTDPEIQRDYQIVSDPKAESTYKPNDYILGESKAQKDRDYQLYAAYLYLNGGDLPDWLDYTAQNNIKALSKKDLETKANQWKSLVDGTRTKRKYKGQNSIADYYASQNTFSTGEARATRGNRFATIVLPNGTYQTVDIHDVKGDQASVGDARKAFNARFNSTETADGAGGGNAQAPKGDTYLMPTIFNEERYSNSFPEWDDLDDKTKAQFDNSVFKYWDEMNKRQAISVPVFVEAGKSVDKAEDEFNAKNAKTQFAQLTKREEIESQIKHAKKLREQLETAYENLRQSAREERGGGVSTMLGDAGQFRAAFHNIDNFIEAGERAIKDRHYSALASFWENFSDADGWTLGLTGLNEALGLNHLASGEGVNPEIEKAFGGKKGVKEFAAAVQYFGQKSKQWREKLGYYDEAGKAGLIQFMGSSLLPTFKVATVAGNAAKGVVKFLGKYAVRALDKGVAETASAGVRAVSQSAINRSLKTALREGGMAAATRYGAARTLNVGVNATALLAQGFTDGTILSVPEVFTNVANHRTGNAKVAEITREGIRFGDKLFVHDDQKSERDVIKETFQRGQAEWMGMRLGEIFGPWSRYLDQHMMSWGKTAYKKTLGKFLDGSNLGKTLGMMAKGAKATDVYKFITNRLEQAGMGGSLTFYAQNNLSQLINAMTVGDKSVGEALSGKKGNNISWADMTWGQIQKAWGAVIDNAIVCGIHTTIGAASYKKQCFDLARLQRKNEKECSRVLGEDYWSKLKHDIDLCGETSDKALIAYTRAIKDNTDLSDEAKQAIINYALTFKTQQALNYGALNNGKTNALDLRYQDAYDAGADVKSPDKISKLQENANSAKEALAKLLGCSTDEVDSKVKGFGEGYREIYEAATKDIQDEQKKKEVQNALDVYFTNLAAVEGAHDALIIDHEQKQEQNKSYVEQNSNKESGTTIQATDKDGRIWYVISGDPRSTNSSDMLIVRDGVTGEIGHGSASEFEFASEQNTQDLVNEGNKSISEEYISKRNAILKGETLPERGDKVSVLDANGKVIEVTVEGIEQSEADGTPTGITVRTEDGQMYNFTTDEYRNAVKGVAEREAATYIGNDNSALSRAVSSSQIATGTEFVHNGKRYTFDHIDDKGNWVARPVDQEDHLVEFSEEEVRTGIDDLLNGKDQDSEQSETNIDEEIKVGTEFTFEDGTPGVVTEIKDDGTIFIASKDSPVSFGETRERVAELIAKSNNAEQATDAIGEGSKTQDSPETATDDRKKQTAADISVDDEITINGHTYKVEGIDGNRCAIEKDGRRYIWRVSDIEKGIEDGRVKINAETKSTDAAGQSSETGIAPVGRTEDESDTGLSEGNKIPEGKAVSSDQETGKLETPHTGVEESSSDVKSQPQEGQTIVAGEKPKEFPASEASIDHHTPALNRIPKDEKGEPMFEKAPLDQSYDALLEQTGGSAETTSEVIKEMIEDKRKALADAEAEEIPHADGAMAKIAARKAHDEKVKQARQELEYWENLARVPEERAKAEEEGIDTNPTSASHGVNESESAAPNDALDHKGTTEHTTDQTSSTQKTETDNKNSVSDQVSEASKGVDTESTGSKKTNARKTDGEPHAHPEQPLTERTRQACESVAKSLGIDVEWVDHLSANGEFDPNGKNGRPVIRIARDAENPLSTVFGHEGTHAVRSISEEAYQSLVDKARVVVGEEEWNKRLNATKELYEGEHLTDGQIVEEVVADIVGEMITNRDMAEKLAYRLDHPTLSALRDVARKMWETVKRFVGGNKLTAYEQAVKDFADTIERAFADAQKAAGTAGVRHSRRRNPTPEERAMRDELANTMKNAGIDVSLDDEVGQKVMDAEREMDDVRMEAKHHSEEAERRNRTLSTVDNAISIVSGRPVKEVRAERKAREEKFKAETKDLYDRVLSGKFDDVTLQRINDYLDNVTPNNEFGRRISKRLPQEVVRRVRKGERASEVDVLFSRISESAVPANERTRPEAKRRIEEKKKELLKGWAIATGNWHTSVEDFTHNTEPIGSGKDSVVYQSDDGKSVIKVSAGKDNLKKFRPDIDAVTLFNHVFRNSPYKILGYGEVDGKFVKFLKQPIVDFTDSTPLSADERVRYMDDLGFKPMNEERTAFTNGTYVVADLQGNNIVRDKAGNIRVIDADVKLHTKDFGGKYQYPAVETDFPADNGIREQRVYHGSGADFDHFDHSHMGEGEGAQVYGWGTYVTEVEGIGRTYARASNQSTLRKEKLKSDISRAKERLPFMKGEYKTALEEEIAQKEEELSKISDANHHLYTVEIPDDNGNNYLDWTKEYSEKDVYSIVDRLLDVAAAKEKDGNLDDYKKFRDAADHIAEWLDGGLENDFFDKLTGENIYRKVAGSFEDYSEEEASKLLSEAGFTGIKYPAENMSGGRADGAKDYVVFNESDAQITDHIRFFRTPNGEAYGFTKGGKIYIDPRIAKADTPIHEYTHLWATALRQGNPKEWANVVNLMKGEKELWNEVKKRYPELKTDDEIADEVLAHYSGKRGAERLREEQRKIAEGEGTTLEKARAIRALEKVKQALDKFWKGVADFLHIHYTSAEEVADRVMSDLLSGVNPTKDGGDSNGGGKRHSRRKGETRTDEQDDMTNVEMAENGNNAVLFREMPKEELSQRVEKYDSENGSELGRFVDYLERGRRLNDGENGRFKIGKTGDLLNKYGINGDISIGTKAVNPNWHTQNEDHNLTPSEWVESMESINNPLAITAYQNKPNSFRIYTNAIKNGKSICLGVDVKRNGNGVEIDGVSEITDIKTAFGRNVESAINRETILYPEGSDAAEQIRRNFAQSSEAHNSLLYGQSSVSGAKVENKSENSQEITEKESPEAKIAAADTLSKEMNLQGNVTVLTSTDGLTGKKASAPGWCDPKTGHITIVLPNNADAADVQKTVFHEAVGHHGLRRLVGDGNFNDFLDNVYNNAEQGITQAIDQLAKEKHQGDRRKATEEYMSTLAEDGSFLNAGNRSLFQKVKQLFTDLLRKAGINLGTELTDNDLRYILWKSYKNLTDNGTPDVFSQAEDIAKQNHLKVGDYAKHETAAQREISNADNERGLLFRTPSAPNNDPMNVASSYYNQKAETLGTKTLFGGLWAAMRHPKENGRKFLNEASESFFDYSRSVKALQDGIAKALGRPIRDDEDAWRTMNTLPAVNQEQLNAVQNNLVAPLGEHIGNIIKNTKDKPSGARTMDDVEIYLNCKHSLERNKAMAERNAEEVMDKAKKNLANMMDKAYAEKLRIMASGDQQAISDYNKEVSNIKSRMAQGKRIADSDYAKVAADQLGTFADRKDLLTVIGQTADAYIDASRDQYVEAQRRDYSGLTEIFHPDYKEQRAQGVTYDVNDLEDEARNLVAQFEGAVGKADIDELWKLVGNLTDFALRKSYVSGNISLQQYQSTKAMYANYVPLRGWNSKNADDVYNYVSGGNGLTPEDFQKVMKKAYGRESRAGYIFGTMIDMATTAVSQGNRNVMKQCLLNLAERSQTNLLRAGEVVYEQSSNGTLTPVLPKVHDGMTEQEIADAYSDWQDDVKNGLANGTYIRINSKLKTGFNAPQWEEDQHQIVVNRNGKKYIVYVNGNPRAAQAVNGLLDFTSDYNATEKRLLRHFAAVQTSFSPEFVVSNAQRDLATAAASGFIKEGAGYTKDFVANYFKIMPGGSLLNGDAKTGTEKVVGIYDLIRRYDRNELDLTNDTDRYYYEFCTNGGKTGITNLRRIEDYQEQVDKMTREVQNKYGTMPRRAVKGILDAIEYINAGVENATRFATYMTSRQRGKSVKQSIHDAKECSVNFNAHGSGAWMDSFFRKHYNYANAVFQSLRMNKEWMKSDPKRYTGVVAGALAMGMLSALLGIAICGGNDDDENGYYGLSEWNRYRFFNIPVAKHGFLHYALPQEFRGMFGTGASIVDLINGKITTDHFVKTLVSNINDFSVVPFYDDDAYNLASGDMSIPGMLVKGFIPTAVAPITDAYLYNRDFLGRPITNATSNNQQAPEWQRAGKDTPQAMIDASKWLNEHTGGQPNRRGGLENATGTMLNPSAIWYIIEQVGGGTMTFATKMKKTFEAMLTGDTSELKVNDIPFAGKFYVSSGDDKSKQRTINEQYNGITQDFKNLDYELRKNWRGKNITDGEFNLRMRELMDEGQVELWDSIVGNEHAIKKMQRAIRKNPDDEELKKELDSLIYQNKVEIVHKYEAWKKKYHK